LRRRAANQDPMPKGVEHAPNIEPAATRMTERTKIQCRKALSTA